jgi:hypothetical protein
VRFVVAFAFIIAPWPGLGSLFVSCVGATATAIADPVFSSSNVTLTVRSPLPEEHQPDWRGVIDVKQDSPDGPVKHAGAMDLRRSGYLQLATFIALAAAWMPKGRRRALTGACVVAGVVSTVVAIPIIDFLAQIDAVHLGAASGTLVSLARRTLVGAPGMAYAVPGIAWLALTRWSMHPAAPRVTAAKSGARTIACSAGHR